VSLAQNGLAVALVDALDDAAIGRLLDRASDEALARLASRLKPHLGGLESDRWLTTTEAADYLGLTLGALHRLTAARRVPFVQDGPGCRCWFKRDELDAWRARGATRPQTIR
jgi:excisionase family DNA binding protein